MQLLIWKYLKYNITNQRLFYIYIWKENKLNILRMVSYEVEYSNMLNYVNIQILL